jgi:AcrR family transcriptional regulator
MEQTAMKMNEKLFIKNPEAHVLGRKIIKDGLLLINQLGYEQFTFKKLAIDIQTSEAGIYRYFENKHKFLIYLIALYWNYIDLKVQMIITNSETPELKLKSIIRVLVMNLNDNKNSSLIEIQLHKLFIWEGTKTYHTRNVNHDNENQLFKPYKDLCARISNVIREANTQYPYSHSLASSIIEIAHSQKYFRDHLPSLTDFNETKNDEQIIIFLNSLLFGAIR